MEQLGFLHYKLPPAVNINDVSQNTIIKDILVFKTHARQRSLEDHSIAHAHNTHKEFCFCLLFHTVSNGCYDMLANTYDKTTI